MKHIITLMQVLFWVVIDIGLLIYFLEWNMYLKSPGHCFKKKNGLVSYVNNYERSSGVPYLKNKYAAAFKL